MKIRNKLAAALFAVGAVFYAQAQDASEVWYIETDTQESVPMYDVSFLLAADDNIYFSIVAKDNHVYDNITRATFSKHSESGGVGNVKACDRLAVYPTVVNRMLNISGCKQDTKVAVISLAGEVCLEAVASDDNTALDVSGLVSGAYILKVGDQSVKFIKR